MKGIEYIIKHISYFSIYFLLLKSYLSKNTVNLLYNQIENYKSLFTFQTCFKFINLILKWFQHILINLFILSHFKLYFKFFALLFYLALLTSLASLNKKNYLTNFIKNDNIILKSSYFIKFRYFAISKWNNYNFRAAIHGSSF